MGVLYEYMLDWSKGSSRRHIDGERSYVERFIRRNEFETLFGGEMLLTDARGTSEFIGVWGRKAASTFKKTLKERGAEFTLRRLDAPDRVVKSYARYYGENRTRASAVKAVTTQAAENP